MTRVIFVIMCTVTFTNMSFGQCWNQKNLQKAYSIDKKISKKTLKLSEKEFLDYLENVNEYYQNLIARRNDFIFKSCNHACTVNVIDSLGIKNSEIEIFDYTDKDPLFLFENKVLNPYLFYANSGFRHNFWFYKQAWENEKRRTLTIQYFNQFYNYRTEDAYNYYEIWVQPNNITNHGITYFIKTEKDTEKLVCVVPALWTEI